MNWANWYSLMRIFAGSDLTLTLDERDDRCSFTAPSLFKYLRSKKFSCDIEPFIVLAKLCFRCICWSNAILNTTLPHTWHEMWHFFICLSIDCSGTLFGQYLHFMNEIFVSCFRSQAGTFTYVTNSNMGCFRSLCARNAADDITFLQTPHWIFHRIGGLSISLHFDAILAETWWNSWCCRINLELIKMLAIISIFWLFLGKSSESANILTIQRRNLLALANVFGFMQENLRKLANILIFQRFDQYFDYLYENLCNRPIFWLFNSKSTAAGLIFWLFQGKFSRFKLRFLGLE